MRTTIALVSNRANLLRKASLAFADHARELGIKARLVVIDDSPQEELALNRKHLEQLAKSELAATTTIEHVDAREARDRAASALESKVPGAHRLFEGKYGGPRNLALLGTALHGEPVVFWDDDVRPLDDALARHQILLAGFDVVNGAYAGHTGSVGMLFAKLQAALEQGDAKRAEEALRGASDQTGYERLSGYRAGNLGLSLRAAEQCAFLPTSRRCEDAVYAGNAARFGLAFFPGADVSNEKYLQKTPFVYHDPPAGGLDRLRRLWEESLRGAQVAKCVREALEQGALEKEPMEAELRALCMEAPRAMLDALEQGRERSRALEPLAAQKLGRTELAEECLKLLRVKREDVALPAEALAGEVRSFLWTQKAWPRAVEEARRKELDVGERLGA